MNNNQNTPNRRFFHHRNRPQQQNSNQQQRRHSHEVTRIEGFTDAVFAFAVTLLVVSLEVPRTFTELLHTMQGFFAFAASFALLAYLWYAHHTFFRRYGLGDAYVVTLNSALLFVVLFFVYPLKFVFSLVIGQLMGQPNSVVTHDNIIEPILGPGQGSTMMLIYGGGYIAVMIIFALMYHYAAGKKESLRLSDTELLDAQASRNGFLLQMGVGVLSIALVLFGGDGMATWAGFAYFLIGPAMAFHGWYYGRQRVSLQKKSEATRVTQQQQRPQQQQRFQQRHHQQRSYQQRQQRPHSARPDQPSSERPDDTERNAPPPDRPQS